MVLYKPILVLILAQPEQIPHLLCFKVSQVSQVRQFNNKTCRFNSCGGTGGLMVGVGYKSDNKAFL